jgi:excisionase family DNA binding protein
MRTASRQIDHDLPESLDRALTEAAALRAAAAKLETQILADIITRLMTAATAAVTPQNCPAMTPPAPPPAVRDKGDGLMSVPEAAEYLSCTPAALRKWILQRRLEPVKLGRLVRVRRQAIAAIAKHGLANRR